jgi:hypothetical protein
VRGGYCRPSRVTKSLRGSSPRERETFACAGNTLRSGWRSQGWAHPRLRGEHQLVVLDAHNAEVHPRVRGEYEAGSSRRLLRPGPSPRAWGARQLLETEALRLIPARAGNTDHPTWCRRGAWFIPTCVGNTRKQKQIQPHRSGEHPLRPTTQRETNPRIRGEPLTQIFKDLGATKAQPARRRESQLFYVTSLDALTAGTSLAAGSAIGR